MSSSYPSSFLLSNERRTGVLSAAAGYSSSLLILKIILKMPERNFGLLMTTTFICAASFFISQAFCFCCILCTARLFCEKRQLFLIAAGGENHKDSPLDRNLCGLSLQKGIADPDGKPVGDLRILQLILCMADAHPACTVAVAEYRKVKSLLIGELHRLS